MDYCDKLRIRSFGNWLLNVCMIIPYLIIGSVFILVILLIYSKYFPSFSQDVINSFGSAILGTIIGGLISFYLTISFRKTDSTDKYLFEKKDKIYSFLYKDFLNITKCITEYNYLTAHKYNSEFWDDLQKGELFLDVPKHIRKWMLEYEDSLIDYEKATTDFETFCNTNPEMKSLVEKENILGFNPILLYIHDYYRYGKEYTNTHADNYKITTKDNVLLNTDKSRDVLNAIISNINRSEEYNTLTYVKIKIDKKAYDLFNLYKYIIKLINTRYNTKIDYI